MSLRDYGLPKPEPLGVPSWAEAPDAPPCPNCGGRVVKVTVAVTLPPEAGGGAGTCVYYGCPACPWASPSVTARQQAGEA